MKAEVHVRPDHGQWGFHVNGIDFGAWPQASAVKMALRTARALSTVSGLTAKVVVHEADGAVRAVLSFGEGLPLRTRCKRRGGAIEATVPLELAARYHRDLEHAPV